MGQASRRPWQAGALAGLAFCCRPDAALGAALLALLLFGGQAIHSFTATMMFGVVLVGTYTSVFIASPILIYLGVGTSRMATSEPEPEPAPAAAVPAGATAAARRKK